MKLIDQLQRQVIDAAAELRRAPRAFDAPWTQDMGHEDFLNTPILLCGCSMFTSIVVQSAPSAHFVAVVDDFRHGKPVLGLPVISSAQMLTWCQKHPRTICINASLGEGGWKHFNHLAEDFNLRLLDWSAWLRLAQVRIPDFVFSNWQSTILSRLDEFLALGAQWMDEQSHRTLLTSLLFHLKTDRSLLMDIYLPAEWSYFRHGAFSISDDEVLVDGGANVGQTVNNFVKHTRGRFSHIHSFEPDSANAQALRETVKGLQIPNCDKRITIHQAALGDRVGIARFNARGTEGSRLLESHETGPADETRITTIDESVEERVTLIKLDVEGFEVSALNGATQTIRRQKPKLSISAYHRPGDVIDCLTALEKMDVGYQYALRLHSASFYDLTLYAC